MKPTVGKLNKRELHRIEFAEKNKDFATKRDYLVNHSILETMKRSKK